MSGSVLLYDLANASLFRPLFIEQVLSQAERQEFAKDFEVRTHARLADLGSQPWPSGRRLRVGSAELTDADASVQIGSLLVVVDCYSSPWTKDLDVGSHRAVRNRAANLIAKLEKWQDQWRDIAASHPGLLPEGVETILPVVVTSTAEWIPSEDRHLWLDPAIPALLTVTELHAFLQSGAAGGHDHCLPVAAR